MTLAATILALVTAQRLAEAAWARANARRLMAAGAIEAGAGHYWVLIGLHAAWLAGLWTLAWDAPVSPAWIGVYLLLQAARAWILWTLGRRWTTRIVVVPGAALVRTGPYRFIRHPNYAVLAAEVATLPAAFGLWWYAALFSLLNLAMLAWRIAAEERALARPRA
ncbi:MAG: isoprenylcysteine carboxylmethyltransferase family protein [Rhodospirillales bacterium]